MNSDFHESRVEIERAESRVGWWIMMLLQTAVHWLSSAEVGAKFGVEQLQAIQKSSMISQLVLKDESFEIIDSETKVGPSE